MSKKVYTDVDSYPILDILELIIDYFCAQNLVSPASYFDNTSCCSSEVTIWSNLQFHLHSTQRNIIAELVEILHSDDL